MERLLIVANRLPVHVVSRKGRLYVQPSIGGLATGLGSYYKSHESVWVGWSGVHLDTVGKRRGAFEKRFKCENCYPVFLSREDIERYYHGFSNKTIWPLFHYFPLYAAYNETWWQAYKRVNRKFCETVMKISKPGDTIWVHDYQLMLLPKYIREASPDATVGFFLHIPFPSSELFRLLPWREELLEGLLGADLIGFHSHDYVHHFLNSIRRILGHDNTLGQIASGNRVVRADTFPMGIDYDRFAGAVSDPEVRKNVEKIRKQVGGRKVILSIDRLDYTKGILQRLEAFDLFLETNRKYKDKVSLILVAVPSRTGVETYMNLKRQLDELVGRINGKHGVIGWIPVWYLYRSIPFHSLVALYHLADVALVTPVRDGMNLIAKEFLAAKTDRKGTLILSEMAGAANELGEAIIVNPNNKGEVARALGEALEMSEDEQIERNWTMQMRLKRYDVMRWAKDFTDRLSSVKEIQERLRAKKLTARMKRQTHRDYVKSRHRLILLDYDGTLIPFGGRPEKVKPDGEILALLRKLCRDRKNEVVIVSGRDKQTLEKWFGGLKIGLMAEHGVWIKERGGSWEMVEPLRNDWKAEIRPILELYVDRTPGSFIEDKEYSLVWHYRKSDLELALVRARELKDALFDLTGNLNLGVLEGSRVIEIKSVGSNKGRGALRWLGKRKWNFVLAVGDDWTDEDTFAVVPDSAYSIKVGWAPSRARFNLDSVAEVRSLLKDLVGG